MPTTVSASTSATGAGPRCQMWGMATTRNTTKGTAPKIVSPSQARLRRIFCR